MTPQENFDLQLAQANLRNQRTTQLLTRPLQLFARVPDPPRGALQSDATLLWSGPKETRNVSHFNIYVGTDENLDRRVPVDQIKSVDVYGTPAWVSSFNEPSGKESPRIKATTEGFPGVPWFPSIRFGGANSTQALGFTDPTSGAITLRSDDVVIVIDPATGKMTFTSLSGTVMVIDGTKITVDDTLGNLLEVGAGLLSATVSPLPSNDRVAELIGYADGNSRGPEVIFSQSGGVLATPLATASGDPLGGGRMRGTYMSGADPLWGNYTARIIAVANEAFTASAQGTDLVFEATPATSNTKAEVMRVRNGKLGIGGTPSYTLDVTGTINGTDYRTGGTGTIGVTKTVGVSLSVHQSYAVVSVDFATPTTSAALFVDSVTLITSTMTWTTGLLTAAS